MRKTDISRVLGQPEPDTLMKHRLLARLKAGRSPSGIAQMLGLLAAGLAVAVLVAGGMFVWQGRGAPEEIPFMPGLGGVDESDGPATPTDLADPADPADPADISAYAEDALSDLMRAAVEKQLAERYAMKLFIYNGVPISIAELQDILKGAFGDVILQVSLYPEVPPIHPEVPGRPSRVGITMDSSVLTKEEAQDLAARIHQMLEGLTAAFDVDLYWLDMYNITLDDGTTWVAMPKGNAYVFLNEETGETYDFWQYAETREVWDIRRGEVADALFAYNGVKDADTLRRHLIDPENADFYIEKFNAIQYHDDNQPYDYLSTVMGTAPVEVDGVLKIALDINYATDYDLPGPPAEGSGIPVIDSEFPWAIEPIMQDGIFVGFKETFSGKDRELPDTYDEALKLLGEFGWGLYRDGDETGLYHGCDRIDVNKEQVIFNGENTVCTVLYMYFLGDATDVSEPGEYTLVVTDLRTNEKIYRLQITQP